MSIEQWLLQVDPTKLSTDNYTVKIVLWVCITLIIIAALINLRKSPNFKDNFNQLFLSMVNLIIDYTFKAIIFFKNFFYFPVGFDHRNFKDEYVVLKTSPNGLLARHKIANDFPIADKNNYLGISVITYMVALYVNFALKHTITLIYGDSPDEFIDNIPILVAIAVFAFDVWIIRSKGQLNPYPHDLFTPEGAGYLIGRIARIFALLLRVIVSASVATVALFHLLTFLARSDIDRAFEEKETTVRFASQEYAKFASARSALVAGEVKIQSLLGCLNIINTGREGRSNLPGFGEDDARNIARKYLIAGERRATLDELAKLSSLAYRCDELIRKDEPSCPSNLASDRCPNLKRYASEGYRLEAEVFGIDAARRRGWFDVARFDPTLRSIKADQLNLKARYDSANDALNNFSPKSSVRDLGTVTLVLEQYFLKSGPTAIILMLAIPVILASFEFSILIMKSSWTKASGDEYHRKLEEASGSAIQNDRTSNSGVLKSRMLLQSEYSLQDHFAAFAEAAFKLSLPLLQSRVWGPLTTISFGYVLIYLTWSETALLRKLVARFGDWIARMIGY